MKSSLKLGFALLVKLMRNWSEKNQCIGSSLNEKLTWKLGSHTEEVLLLVLRRVPVGPYISFTSWQTPSHLDIINIS